MKVLLTSIGFTTPDIIDAAVGLTGKAQAEVKIAVLNEAHSVVPGDKHWLIGELGQLADAFTGEVDLVNIQALAKEEWLPRITDADMIYVPGGHTDYLMRTFEKTGFAAELPKLLASKVYVGSSAGGMILGRRATESVYRSVYGEEPGYGVVRYMDILPFHLMPHLDSDFFVTCRQGTILAASQEQSAPVIALRDNQALIVTRDNLQPVGGELFVAVSGKPGDLNQF